MNTRSDRRSGLASNPLQAVFTASQVENAGRARQFDHAGRNTVLRLLGRTKIAATGCQHAKLAGAIPDASDPPAR